MKPKNKTYLRILEKSRQLFNRAGVFKVPVQQIADELLLSPGNVTYHFKKKNDIIHGIVDQLESEFVEVQEELLNLEVSDSEPDLHVEYTLKVIALLWKYRFVFNNIVFLEREDTVFGERFEDMQDKLLDIFVRLANFSIERGWIKPLANDKAVRLLCENIMHVWLNSLRMSQLKGQEPNAGENQAINYILVHHVAMLSPYYTPEHAAVFAKFID